MIHTRAEVELKYNHELHVLAHCVLADVDHPGECVKLNIEDVPAVEKALKEMTGRRAQLGYNVSDQTWFVDRIWYLERTAK